MSYDRHPAFEIENLKSNDSRYPVLVENKSKVVFMTLVCWGFWKLPISRVAGNCERDLNSRSCRLDCFLCLHSVSGMVRGDSMGKKK
jgi:hypothetical protein